MSRNDGLWIFVAVVGLNVIGLLTDYVLLQCGLVTVTEFARRNAWAGAIICVLQAIGSTGLAFHFFRTNGE